MAIIAELLANALFLRREFLLLLFDLSQAVASAAFVEDEQRLQKREKSIIRQRQEVKCEIEGIVVKMFRVFWSHSHR